MAMASQNQVPIINLSRTSLHCVRGEQEWHNLCKRVREACETFGCFEVVYDQISLQLRDETFEMVRQVFSLPSETKKKNFNPKPYHGYAGGYPVIPLYESLGIEDVTNYDSLRSFTELLWPHGHHQFNQTISSTLKPVEELCKIIQKMIIDSYGLKEKLGLIMETKTLLRMMKYKAPPSGEYMDGLKAHTEKPMCTLLFEDQVSGLEIETKDGHWIQLSPSTTNFFFFIVGDPLMAWSDGKLHAVKLRVMMKGDKDRYSFGAFAVPVEGTIIKPPKELDDGNHPQLLKEFDYMDFIIFSYSKGGMAIESATQMFAFVGNN
ncbi:2-oxoglutarate-dependent dioxygenase AOP2-like [Jatropha curcas]|uniref:2-oxoglutarate-dependent dioxygenase AOP2-like n=1 Tax=Jatropha curcas TaxID=180498 RepID=UPI0018959BAE|nr:2-oxoglutarate-dependent dioxygenase AOP2-like [Jatropha curcas]